MVIDTAGGATTLKVELTLRQAGDSVRLPSDDPVRGVSAFPLYLKRSAISSRTWTAEDIRA
jgi:hypothetical protein